MKKCEYTNKIVCPYCGYEFVNSNEFELVEGDTELIQCEECEKEFYADVNIEVTYSTFEAKYGTCECCGDEDVIIEDYHSSIGGYKNLCESCGIKKKHELEIKYEESIEITEEEFNQTVAEAHKKMDEIIGG